MTPFAPTGQILEIAAALLMLTALLWWVGARVGFVRPSSPFSAFDVRRWPLSFALLDMGLTILAFTCAGSYFGTGVLSALVAVSAVSVVSPLLARLYR